jgi:aminopeptidase N
MRLTSLVLATLIMSMLMSCHPKPTPKTFKDSSETVQTRPDPHSFSRHDQVMVTHLDLDLKVKFKQQILEGFAVLHYQRLDKTISQLVLDSRDLKIKRIEAMNDSKNNKLLWRNGQSIEGLGSELIIDLPQDNAPIKIHYETMPQASGLQWLSPQQTSGKKQPFLFSQWIPIQDTPSIRVTYNATIRVRPEVKALLSADNNSQQAVDGVHKFTMKQPIPPYLIAIAVGDLSMQQISEHVAIFAELAVLEAAAYEFAATEDMITATEALYGPYRWGQYDLLVLPPSFPFGGMENPKLSHITPTIIAGDRSLDSLIAHELAHSWSGNLVTNALWQDAWLNEGFTSYIEARIIDAIYGEDRMMMEATLAYQALLFEMQELTTDQQKLVNPTPSADPDDFFSAVSYDKGRFFLEWMEQQVGREAFDQFLIQYFDHFAFQSIETSDFVTFLNQHLLTNHRDKISTNQIDTWLFQPGMPEFFTPPTTNRFKLIDQQVEAWNSGQLKTDEINSHNWTTQEWLHFLRALPKQMSPQHMQQLDQTFNFTTRQNSEIAHDWLLISINNQYQVAYARLIDYLSNIGRVKLIKPLYEALMKNSELHNLAMNIYLKSRPGYHNIAIKQIDTIVGYDEPDESH